MLKEVGNAIECASDSRFHARRWLGKFFKRISRSRDLLSPIERIVIENSIRHTRETITMKAFEYRCRVTFGDTNLVGNVYFANHIRWQGCCREMFLHQHAPQLLDELTRDLCLVTTRCSCEYLTELSAFDEVLIRMRLGALMQNRMVLHFEYWRTTGTGEELIAKGEQQVACMRRKQDGLIPTPIPESLAKALEPYSMQ
jgi:enediyne biosynthesis thioesterase